VNRVRRASRLLGFRIGVLACEMMRMLYGRSEQIADIARLLGEMRSGRAGVLVFRGEPGIGKTALLDAAAEQAAGARLLRVTGVEGEAELPFAALYALLRPVLDVAGTLPERQAAALRGAFGLAEAAGADRYLIGLAVLSLIAELAEDQPVLCLVDDAHWLDRASADALAFAVRRLHAERVAVIFAARDEPPGIDLPGFAESRLEGLDGEAAGHLLSVPGLTLAVRDRLIAEAAGNPLALLELSRGLSPGQKAGFVTPLPLSGASPPGRVQAAYAIRIAGLPEECRRALLIAALNGAAALPEVSKAVTAAGGSLTDLAPAERDGLARVTPARVIFSHPLVRAAVLAGSDVAGRMTAHRALAGVLDGERRAWHLAALAVGPDEEAASALDAAAQQAGRRGSRAAMSVAYEQAAELSDDPASRGRRLTLAAETAAEAGQLPRAASLAGQAGRLVADPVGAAKLARVRAQLRYETDRPAEATGILLDGAERLASADPRTAGAMAVQSVIYLWRSVASPAHADLERRAGAMLPSAESRFLEFLQAVRRLQDGDPEALATVSAWPASHPVPVSIRSSSLSFDLVQGDLSAARSRAAGFADECRVNGTASLLAHALGYLARAQGLHGEYLDATASAEEGLRIAADTEQSGLAGRLSVVAAELAAVTGDAEKCRTAAAEARQRSAGVWTTALAGADCALARLDLGLARYGQALDRLQAVTAGPSRHAHLLLYAYPDHVEAAVRAGHPGLAARPLAMFTAWASGIAQPWAAAVAARCAALTAADADAEPLYRRALTGDDGDGPPLERARTSLAYGEWLRRHQRRADAREQLLTAASDFAALGARPWQGRAEAELRAVGGTVPAVAGDDRLARLTPQELQVVRLAATGASNKQIGARLFLSPRTVGYHLYKAFPKLGVASREELARYAP
jgi:DNA-binding CsgD family transcriptional regulator